MEPQLFYGKMGSDDGPEPKKLKTVASSSPAVSQLETEQIARKDATIPFSQEQIEEILAKFPTPVHVYDERRIRQQCRNLKDCFGGISEKPYMNYFAVKATPTPEVMRIMKNEGFGADCSSFGELLLAERCGFTGEEIMFTSNNTPAEEFRKAHELGAVINFDDISHIDFCAHALGGKLPELVCFRFNPGPERTGNVLIGDPKEAKYGVSKPQLFEAYRRCRDLGAKRFALHTMVISNCIESSELVETARMLFQLVKQVRDELGITLEFVNLGGGVGIPYKVDEEVLDLSKVREGLQQVWKEIVVESGLSSLRIVTECGRYVTAPAGYLVAKVCHQKRIYKNYVGLDACMANLMRPGMYGAYHHITCVPINNPALLSPGAVLLREQAFKDNTAEMKLAGFDVEKFGSLYDITGGLCENNDKFGIDRYLPVRPRSGDVCFIHDSGAHGHSMGFNYNAKLRSAEVLVREDGAQQLIRRAETYEDFFACVKEFY